jgi:hypothetical protein
LAECRRRGPQNWRARWKSEFELRKFECSSAGRL